MDDTEYGIVKCIATGAVAMGCIVNTDEAQWDEEAVSVVIEAVVNGARSMGILITEDEAYSICRGLGMAEVGDPF